VRGPLDKCRSKRAHAAWTVRMTWCARFTRLRARTHSTCLARCTGTGVRPTRRGPGSSTAVWGRQGERGPAWGRPHGSTGSPRGIEYAFFRQVGPARRAAGGPWAWGAETAAGWVAVISVESHLTLSTPWFQEQFVANIKVSVEMHGLHESISIFVKKVSQKSEQINIIFLQIFPEFQGSRETIFFLDEGKAREPGRRLCTSSSSRCGLR
jgi:hypothetical protein